MNRSSAVWVLLLSSVALAADLKPPKPFVQGPSGPDTTVLNDGALITVPLPAGPAAVPLIKSRAWALVLGKALFWDQQAGSDRNACASCHFHAGADARISNALNPGMNDLTVSEEGDFSFGSIRSDTGEVGLGKMPSGATAGPNYVLTPADMPMHQLADESDRNSPIRTTTNDRISSQGSFDATFGRVRRRGHFDRCRNVDASVFHAGPYAARQVEPRNTGTVINSVFFHRNFWDGRANNLFNGVGVFGMRDIAGDPNMRLMLFDACGKPQPTHLQLENASLASQAVGPPLSGLEMSCDGRRFPDVARRLLSTRPLKDQKIDPTDTVLGPYVHPTRKGLAQQLRYSELIKKAFHQVWWERPGRWEISNGVWRSDWQGHSQMEHNFSMFWGIALMLYQSTLISNQSEFDTLVASGRLVFSPSFAPAGPGIGRCSSPTGDVDELMLRGCTIFARAAGAGAAGAPPADGVRGGNCFICHNGPGGGIGISQNAAMLSQSAFQDGQSFAPFIQVGKNRGGVHRHDQGFMSIGLRPVFSDLMNGGNDPYGNPLSFTRQYQNHLAGKPNAILDPSLQRLVDAGGLGALTAPAPVLGVDSASKSPILRNIALTPPYFSWGGYPSLRQVLKVYNRGLNRRDITSTDDLDLNPGTGCATGDDSGSGPTGDSVFPLSGVTDCNSNTTATILPLALQDCDQTPEACTAAARTPANDDLAALQRFLQSLTDPRVQCSQAPFEHPSLVLTDGHHAMDSNHNRRADDLTFTLPAVGAAGHDPASGYCIPNTGDLFAPGMQSRSGGP